MRLIASFLLLLAPSPAATPDPAAGLRKCATVPDGLPRLVCYDHLAKSAEGSADPSAAALPAVSTASTASPANDKPAATIRCQAITKKGTQSKRNAMPGPRYCWQHQPKK